MSYKIHVVAANDIKTINQLRRSHLVMQRASGPALAVARAHVYLPVKKEMSN